MSCSAYAVHVIGVKFNFKDTIKKYPNPLWGKFKFNPEDGKKVTPVIEDRTTIELIQKWLEENDNIEKNTFKTHDYDGTFFYGAITRIITDSEEYEILTENHVDALPNNFQELITLLDVHKVSHEEGSWLIGQLSC